jgi:hypothetical protein
MESKCGRCVGLKTLSLSCADCLKIWDLQPPGTLRARERPLMGLLYFCVKESEIKQAVIKMKE